MFWIILLICTLPGLWVLEKLINYHTRDKD